MLKNAYDEKVDGKPGAICAKYESSGLKGSTTISTGKGNHGSLTFGKI